MQQCRCYYCPKEFHTFSDTIDHTWKYHQHQKIKIKIVKTSVCLFGCLCWGRSGMVNPGVGTARSLLMHTWARMIGLRNLHTKRCERHERREKTGEKTKVSALYTPSPRFKAIISKCLFSFCVHCDPDLWPIFLIMDNIWTKLITGLYVFHHVVSIFVHCDLDLSSLALTINRDHPLTMDNKCACTKFDQD